MSHFSVLVLGADPEHELSPFDQKLKVAAYVPFTLKDKQNERRQRIREYTEILRDKPSGYDLTFVKKHLQRIKAQTDREYFEERVSCFPNRTRQGNPLSTYNRNAKWDWCELGGRWQGRLKIKAGKEGTVGERSRFIGENGHNNGYADQARFEDIAWEDEVTRYFLPFAVLKDGLWHEKGQMGWFGVARNEKSNAQWKGEFLELLSYVTDETLVSVYDCHI